MDIQVVPPEFYKLCCRLPLPGLYPTGYLRRALSLQNNEKPYKPDIFAQLTGNKKNLKKKKKKKYQPYIYSYLNYV